MNSIFTNNWTQRIKSSYESSQWTDEVGISFGGRELPEMLQSLYGLGDVADSAAVFVKKAEELLRD